MGNIIQYNNQPKTVAIIKIFNVYVEITKDCKEWKKPNRLQRYLLKKLLCIDVILEDS